jgi:hypothetical protein
LPVDRQQQCLLSYVFVHATGAIVGLSDVIPDITIVQHQQQQHTSAATTYKSGAI